MSNIVMIRKVQKPAQGVEIPENHKNCNKRTVFTDIWRYWLSPLAALRVWLDGRRDPSLRSG